MGSPKTTPLPSRFLLKTVPSLSWVLAAEATEKPFVITSDIFRVSESTRYTVALW